MIYYICKELPAYKIKDLTDDFFVDVIDLYSDIRTMQITEKKMNDPNRIIRRPASDTWF